MDKTTCGVCGASKARMYSCPRPVYADSCVYIMCFHSHSKIRLGGVGPSFLRKLREIFPRHSGGGEKKKKRVPHLNNLTVTQQCKTR